MRIIIFQDSAQIERLCKQFIIFFKTVHALRDYLRTIPLFISRDLERSRCVSYFLWKIRGKLLIDVYPCPDDDMSYVVYLRAHFRKDPADLTSIYHKIIWPFDADVRMCDLFKSSKRAVCRYKRQHRRIFRCKIRFKRYRH